MANLYTKTGDTGTTGLVGGSRTAKCSRRVECYGTTDEANAALGMAYALTRNQYVKDCIDMIQRKLFLVGAELASDEKGLPLLRDNRICEEDIRQLEGIVDRCTLTTGAQTEFVIPGVNPASAALHMARTVVRRAERAVIAARKTETMRDILGKYMNRLSDAIYALARLEETVALQEGGGKYRSWPPKQRKNETGK